MLLLIISYPFLPLPTSPDCEDQKPLKDVLHWDLYEDYIFGCQKKTRQPQSTAFRQDCLLRRLRLVQDDAAGIIPATGIRRRDHTQPVLSVLHWLSVHQRVCYQILHFIHKLLPHRTFLHHQYIGKNCSQFLCLYAGCAPHKTNGN